MQTSKVQISLCIHTVWSEINGLLTETLDKINVLKYWYTNDKVAYANSVDPDQTTPEGAVWSGSTLFAIPLSILRNNCIKIKT